MVSRSEGTFTARDGVKLYTKTWTPDAPSANHLIFIHGFSDHINAYYDLFPTLSSLPYNITVHGFDQRGWGRSVTNKSSWGQTGDTHQVLSDIHDFAAHVSKIVSSTDPSAEFFLMGHSMGGAESLMYLLSDPNTLSINTDSAPLRISGLLVESPHIGFPPASEPSSLLVFSGRLAGKLLPNMQMVQKLDSSAMCRDPKVCKDWDDDELCHDTGTLRGLAGLLDRASYLNGLGRGTAKVQTGMSETLPCPVFWAHGTADQVCDYVGSKRLYDRLIETRSADDVAKQSKFVAYDGGYHKLHGEPDGMGKQFTMDAGDWILSVAGGGRRPDASLTGSASDVQDLNERGSTMSTTAGTESMLDGEGVKSRL